MEYEVLIGSCESIVQVRKYKKIQWIQLSKEKKLIQSWYCLVIYLKFTWIINDKFSESVHDKKWLILFFLQMMLYKSNLNSVSVINY